MIAPLESITPHLESPLAEPMVLLRQLAKEEIDRAKELQFSEGFILKNLEANCKHILQTDLLLCNCLWEELRN